MYRKFLEKVPWNQTFQATTIPKTDREILEGLLFIYNNLYLMEIIPFNISAFLSLTQHCEGNDGKVLKTSFMPLFLLVLQESLQNCEPLRTLLPRVLTKTKIRDRKTPVWLNLHCFSPLILWSSTAALLTLPTVTTKSFGDPAFNCYTPQIGTCCL